MTEAETGIASVRAVEPSRSIEPAAILAEWYDRYARDLFRYAFALTGSAEDAEDAVQEAFAGAARQSRRLLRVRQSRAYLITATRNAAYSILRSRRRRGDLLHSLVAEENPHGAAPPALSIQSTLRSCFGELPIEQREVLALKVFEEMSFREIAQATGVSLNTAASRYRYGIEKLRKRLEEQEDE